MTANWLKNYNLLSFETLDSTNTEGLRLAKAGVDGNFVILSKEQTSGKGSKGRDWSSIPDNLHASILIDSSVNPNRHSQIPFILSNSIYDAISELAKQSGVEVNIELKWPNDIFINDKKICGILPESINLGEKNFVVIGMGVNLIDSPKNINVETTCLSDLGIIIPSPEEFLTMIMNDFDKVFLRWVEDIDFSSTRELWMQRAKNINRIITVDDGKRRISGMFNDIAEDGAMRLELASGEIVTLASCDLVMKGQLKC